MSSWPAPHRSTRGFDTATLASMIATLERFADDEIPVPEGTSAAELRAFYAEWQSELMKQSED
jgi:hypothetical protein